jgi:hypothetical protein
MLRLGDAASIIFLDHCSRQGVEGRGPMVFEVLGRVIEITKEYYTIAPWISPDLIVDNNMETYVILRSTIKKERRLK